MAALLDAALHHPHPASFLDSAAISFTMIGRKTDQTRTSWIRILYAKGQVEIPMALRAAWCRGEAHI